jgi:hypothetical protein
VPLTPDQKKWVVGGSIGASALFIGYLLFRRPAHAGFLPGGRSHEGHEHRKKKHRRSEGEGEGESAQENGNGRGEYGRKKKHHHGERKHG